jgi:phosphatidate cytidylyltransferase
VAAVLGALWLVGACEWSQFAADYREWSLAYATVFLVIMLLVGPLFDASGAHSVAWTALVWWVFAAFALWAYPRRVPTTIVMLSGPIALLPAWFLLAYIHGSGSQGPALALGVMVIIWAADVGAYLVGRRFGRVKLARQISPGKTWEGVIGGMISASLAALAAGVLLSFPLLAFVSVALAATLVSIVGDLTVSMFKRYVGLKDSGRLLPGHGGVLDRIDSLSAAVPFFFIGLEITGL